MIEIGKVYYITGGTLKAANKQYSTLNNDYEMTLKDSSEISLCTDAAETSSIPTLSFNFAKIGSLDASLKDRWDFFTILEKIRPSKVIKNGVHF